MTNIENKINVCYNVSQDGEYQVDITLEDYSEETVEQLATLLSSIPSVQFQVQTMNIVKDAFIRHGKNKELEQLITSVVLKSEKMLEKIDLEMTKEDTKQDSNEPCIKPSDIL